ncbi:MAG: group 1 truncated hemoglobin [Kofleriaceae bacterium]
MTAIFCDLILELGVEFLYLPIRPIATFVLKASASRSQLALSGATGNLEEYMRTRTILLAAIAALSLAACGGGSKKESTTDSEMAASAEQSLYDRLGGKDAISAVVDAFVANVAADDRVNGFFKDTDIPHLKQMLVEQICNATGGPCEYTGKDMKTTHTGMNITEDHWNATVEDLVKALDDAGVQQKEKDEILGALGGMKADIVGL